MKFWCWCKMVFVEYEYEESKNKISFRKLIQPEIVKNDQLNSWIWWTKTHDHNPGSVGFFIVKNCTNFRFRATLGHSGTSDSWYRWWIMTSHQKRNELCTLEAAHHVTYRYFEHVKLQIFQNECTVQYNVYSFSRKNLI